MANERVLTVWECIKTVRFLKMFTMLWFGIFYGYFMAGTYKTISDLPDSYLTLVGSVGSIFNGGTRVIWGATMDKTGFKKLYIFIMTV